MVPKSTECEFCSDPKINQRMVYKDDSVMSFVGYMPIVPGHIIVCPVRCVSKIDDLNENELRSIKTFLVKVKIELKKQFDATGFNIAWNEGKTAGQTVPHLHIHVLPRKEGDSGITEYEPRKFLYRPGSREKTPQDELQSIAERIKIALRH